MQRGSTITGSLKLDWQRWVGNEAYSTNAPAFINARRHYQRHIYQAIHKSQPYDQIERIRHKAKRWNLWLREDEAPSGMTMKHLYTAGNLSRLMAK